MDNEIEKKIDVTAIQFLLVQNRQQTHDWTLIGSGANGMGIQVWFCHLGFLMLKVFHKPVLYKLHRKIVFYRQALAFITLCEYFSDQRY